MMYSAIKVLLELELYKYKSHFTLSWGQGNVLCVWLD